METSKEYYYTYYSYEEWGRGYIGSRGCECLPEEDVKYFGSFKDKSFKPTQKIILEIYETREQAIEAEVILHDFYDVANNPHFANRAKQTSTKFYISKELGLGIHALTTEQRREIGKKSSETNKKNGTGVYGMTFEQKSGGGNKAKELGVGIFSMTADELSEAGKKGNKKTNAQKWKCTETGYVTNSGALSGYQKARRIDTTKRVRVL